MPARPPASPQAGKFGIIPTLINTVAAFTSIGVVSQPGAGGRPMPYSTVGTPPAAPGPNGAAP